MDCSGQLSSGVKELKLDVFLLTKPPCSDRARFCLQLIMLSENAVLYLAGDGVYNLLGKALEALPKERILACREDLEARGMQAEDNAIIMADFYDRLVEDMMQGRKLYTF